ncbi:MAG: DUF4956 domain-containing protein [Spirochaetales bacterium]|nr:DUF4956 domain-containing protein [Spirochaetales bacterium]
MSYIHGIFSLATIDRETLYSLFFRLALNLGFLYLIIHHIYYRFNGKHKFIQSFYVVNILIFFITSLLVSANIQTGFAFGLFAVFSIFQYRTDEISIRNMTYLFLFIVLAVVNSLVTIHLSIYFIIFTNVFIFISLFLLEMRNAMTKVESLTIDMEDIQLVHKERQDDLIKELKERTGLNILSTEVTSIDYLKDAFKIKAFYKGDNPFN